MTVAAYAQLGHRHDGPPGDDPLALDLPAWVGA